MRNIAFYHSLLQSGPECPHQLRNHTPLGHQLHPHLLYGHVRWRPPPPPPPATHRPQWHHSHLHTRGIRNGTASSAPPACSCRSISSSCVASCPRRASGMRSNLSAAAAPPDRAWTPPQTPIASAPPVRTPPPAEPPPRTRARRARGPAARGETQAASPVCPRHKQAPRRILTHVHHPHLPHHKEPIPMDQPRVLHDPSSSRGHQVHAAHHRHPRPPGQQISRATLGRHHASRAVRSSRDRLPSPSLRLCQHVHTLLNGRPPAPPPAPPPPPATRSPKWHSRNPASNHAPHCRSS